MTGSRLAAAATFFIFAASAALADKADVMDVKVRKEASGIYAFDVTVKSDDTGWEKYADKWEVLGPDGAVLGTRELLHPHENEQPFTRSLGGVAVPDSVTTVTVRAHDKVEGYGGKEMTIELPR
jgi:hypothetical protein